MISFQFRFFCCFELIFVKLSQMPIELNLFYLFGENVNKDKRNERWNEI